MKSKRSYKEGDFLRIQVEKNVYAFGQLVLQQSILVYDYFQFQPELNLSIQALKNKPVLFYVPVTDSVLQNILVENVGGHELTSEDKLKQPPLAWIDIADPSNCILLYPDDREVKATAEMCIGLERVGAWGFIHITNRIKKYLFENTVS